jgi:hypothetical protein
MFLFAFLTSILHNTLIFSGLHLAVEFQSEFDRIRTHSLQGNNKEHDIPRGNLAVFFASFVLTSFCFGFFAGHVIVCVCVCVCVCI